VGGRRRHTGAGARILTLVAALEREQWVRLARKGSLPCRDRGRLVAQVSGPTGPTRLPIWSCP